MKTETLLVLICETEKKQLLKLVPKGHTPLWVHWDDFVKKYLRLGRSPNTVKNVRDTLKWMFKHIKVYSIEECFETEGLEDKFHEYAEDRNLSGSTYNSYRKNLNTYFKWMARYKRIEYNPIMDIPAVEVKTRRLNVLSEQQIQMIVCQVYTRRQSTLERARNTFLIDLLRFTGARPIELERLKMTDIRKTKNGYVLKIHGAKQKGKPRLYTLKSYIAHSYERYMRIKEIYRPDHEQLLISQSKQTGFTRKGITRLMKKLGQELGFPVTAYGFRRHVATRLKKEGLDMFEIGDYLGHTRVSTTKKYLDHIPDWTDKGSDIMANLLI